jgi:hypothetical protein
MATAAFFSVPTGARFTVTVVQSAEVSLYSQTRLDRIERLEGYRVLRPIPVVYEIASDTDVEARFDDANIAMSGNSRLDARQALVEEMLSTFDDYTADEAALGPGPKQQLALLRTYIAKAG